jgi:hypothetical protein
VLFRPVSLPSLFAPVNKSRSIIQFYTICLQRNIPNIGISLEDLVDGNGSGASPTEPIGQFKDGNSSDHRLVHNEVKGKLIFTS